MPRCVGWCAPRLRSGGPPPRCAHLSLPSGLAGSCPAVCAASTRRCLRCATPRSARAGPTSPCEARVPFADSLGRAFAEPHAMAPPPDRPTRRLDDQVADTPSPGRTRRGRRACAVPRNSAQRTRVGGCLHGDGLWSVTLTRARRRPGEGACAGQGWGRPPLDAARVLDRPAAPAVGHVQARSRTSAPALGRPQQRPLR